jgi:hypothetical protein
MADERRRTEDNRSTDEDITGIASDADDMSDDEFDDDEAEDADEGEEVEGD